MKVVKKILIILIVSIFCYLLNKHFSSEIFLQSNNYVLKTEQNSYPSYCFFSNNSPLQLALPENNIFTTNVVYQQVIKINSFSFFSFIQKIKNEIFYSTSGYTSLFKYICNKLKKSDLIFPFHYFL